MTTRAEFLGRIRAQMARSPGLFTAETSVRPVRPAERLQVLRRELSERWRENLERFRHEFERVGGVLHRVAEPGEVPDTIARIAGERGMRRVVAWHADALGLEVAAPLAARGLEATAAPAGEVAAAERERRRAVAAAADLGVTGVDLAIAETGTLVVVSGAGRPRSASLLPACHVAVFGREALVESLLQAGLALEAWHDGPPPGERGASINFITGPSRTADIELTLTRGVHGPKEVHAVFVDQGLAPVMAERYFAPEEVERLIPRLAECMRRVMAAQAAAQEAQQWLDAEQQRITTSGGGVLDQAAWRQRRERVEAGTRELRQGLDEIQGLGGVTKDLGLGLVDFAHLREGRVVNLCWRYGERRITHWHGLDEGYAARKPL